MNKSRIARQFDEDRVAIRPPRPVQMFACRSNRRLWARSTVRRIESERHGTWNVFASSVCNRSAAEQANETGGYAPVKEKPRSRNRGTPLDKLPPRHCSFAHDESPFVTGITPAGSRTSRWTGAYFISRRLLDIIRFADSVCNPVVGQELVELADGRGTDPCEHIPQVSSFHIVHIR
jgi:hypothetical protein